jgi:hypothetical protein
LKSSAERVQNKGMTNLAERIAQLEPQIQKAASLGALGVAGGSMLAWLGLVWFIRPVPTGGFDSTSHVAASAAIFMVLGLMAAAHLWFGLQLKRGRTSITG